CISAVRLWILHMYATCCRRRPFIMRLSGPEDLTQSESVDRHFESIIDPYLGTPGARRLPALPASAHGPDLAILLHSPNWPLGGWIIPVSPRAVRPGALRTGARPSPHPRPYAVLQFSLVMSFFLREKTSWKPRFSAPSS